MENLTRAFKVKTLSWSVSPSKTIGATGVTADYRIKASEEGIWWRYGRNIGVYGKAKSYGEAKRACQAHYENEVKQHIELE